MTSSPKVSVVLATLNRASYLKRMLDNLLRNQYANLEIIVVDGGSTDGTVKLLESYDEGVIHWISERDSGEYYALNKGLRMATGEIIKLMTDDDVLRPDCFRWAVDYLLAHPDVDIVFGQTAYWKEEAGRNQFLHESCMMSPERLTVRHWVRETQGVSSLSSFVRRRVFDRIGLLATKYACGDVEFWTRAASRGVGMGLIPQVVVDYFITGENGVIRKRWKIASDMVAINATYGNAADVVNCLWRRYPQHLLVLVLSPLGLHPLRKWRRWKADSARWLSS